MEQCCGRARVKDSAPDAARALWTHGLVRVRNARARDHRRRVEREHRAIRVELRVHVHRAAQRDVAHVVARAHASAYDRHGEPVRRVTRLEARRIDRDGEEVRLAERRNDAAGLGDVDEAVDLRGARDAVLEHGRGLVRRVAHHGLGGLARRLEQHEREFERRGHVGDELRRTGARRRVHRVAGCRFARARDAHRCAIVAMRR